MKKKNNRKKYAKRNSWKIIKRYLNSCIGQKWDKVYSQIVSDWGNELYRETKKGWALIHYVKHNVVMPTEVVPYWRIGSYLYVDKNGYLRKKESEPKKEKEKLYIELDKNKYAFQLNGIWMILEEPGKTLFYFTSLRRKAALTRQVVNELIQAIMNPTEKNKVRGKTDNKNIVKISSFYYSVTCAYRHMTKKELKKYNLSNK